MRPAIIIVFFVFLAGAVCAARTVERGLLSFTNVVWLAAPGNDGDSFAVRCDDRTLRLRLYFVDTPEITLEGQGMAARVNTQRRYFGLAQNEQVFAFGCQASAFTRAALGQPFTICTTFTDARGEGGRIYAFVRTAEGFDLGTALVKAGLARAYGYGHTTPEGGSAAVARTSLRQSEAAAREAAVGVWRAVQKTGTPNINRQLPKIARSTPFPPTAAPVVLLLVLVVVLVVCAGLWM